MNKSAGRVGRGTPITNTETGDDIELTDVNGNKVKVPLYPLFAALADLIRGRDGDGKSIVVSTSRPGEWLHIDLEDVAKDDSSGERMRAALEKARLWIWRQPNWGHHEPETSNALLREIDRALAEGK